MREEMETNLIRSLIQSYFNIVRQTIQDLVPKAIMHFLVNNTSQQVQNRLVAALYKPELFGELLNEDEALVAERTRVKALLDASGFGYRYLPAYSPDLNPIEPIWAKVKAGLRRVAARSTEALHQALGPALDAVTPQDAAGCFRHCGYGRPG